jgi:hypothetical protein
MVRPPYPESNTPIGPLSSINQIYKKRATSVALSFM